MRTSIRLIVLFLLSIAIEVVLVGVYYYYATGTLAETLAVHTTALESMSIPASSEIDLQNDDWTRVARFESTVGQALLIIDILFAFLVAWVFIAHGVSQAIAGRTRLLGFTSINASNAAYLILYALIGAVLGLPLAISGHLIALVRGTSFPTSEVLISSIFNNTIFTIVFLLLMYVPFYWIMRRFKTYWWVIGAGFMFCFMAFTTYISPAVIDPFFYETRPLENEAVKEELRDIVDNAGIPIERVSEARVSGTTYESNAVVAGFGATERIILDDTLLTFYTPREIRFIVAHELGHYVHKDYLKQFAALGIITFISLWLLERLLSWIIGKYGRRLNVRDAHDIVLFPLIGAILTFLPFLTAPITSAVSRSYEHSADVYAIETTRDPQAGVDGIKKLSYQSFVDPSPPAFLQYWFGTHPTMQERVDYFTSQI